MRPALVDAVKLYLHVHVTASPAAEAVVVYTINPRWAPLMCYLYFASTLCLTVHHTLYVYALMPCMPLCVGTVSLCVKYMYSTCLYLMVTVDMIVSCAHT